MSKRGSKWRWIGPLLLVSALVTEKSKDPSQRTGRGKVGGVVPYDFTAPTFQRFKMALWNPRSDRLLMPTPFGAGWTINFAEALRILKKARSEA